MHGNDAHNHEGRTNGGRCDVLPDFPQRDNRAAVAGFAVQEVVGEYRTGGGPETILIMKQARCNIKLLFLGNDTFDGWCTWDGGRHLGAIKHAVYWRTEFWQLWRTIDNKGQFLLIFE